MNNPLESLVPLLDLDIAFSGTNFGPQPNHRGILRMTLLKCASGYATGSTAKAITEELRLTKNWKLTKKGREYLFEAFKTDED